MTLILSIAAPHFVAHVSDRRLTSKGNLVDDDTNKLVVFGNRCVFGYTGLAFLNPAQSEPTDWWLTQRLSEVTSHNLEDAVMHVRDRATEAFQRLKWRACYKHHAFIGVGWQDTNDGSLFPVLVRISNYHDGEIVMTTPKDTFEIQKGVFKFPQYGICHTGAKVQPQDWTVLERSVRRCAEKGTGPRPAMDQLVRFIRKIASQDRSVGKNLLAVTMSIGAARSSYPAVFSPGGFGIAAGPEDFEGAPPRYPPGGPGPDHSIVSQYLPYGKPRLDYGVSFAYPGIAIDKVVSVLDP